MIAELDDILTRMVKADHGDDPGSEDDEDEAADDDLPGLYYPLDYVVLTWRERNERHILPESGGLNDQDWRLVYYDWPLVTARYSRIDRALYPPKEGEGSKGITLPDTGRTRSVMDVFREPE